MKRVREELLTVVFVSLPRGPLTPEQRGGNIPAVTSSRDI